MRFVDSMVIPDITRRAASDDKPRVLLGTDSRKHVIHVTDPEANELAYFQTIDASNTTQMNASESRIYGTKLINARGFRHHMIPNCAVTSTGSTESNVPVASVRGSISDFPNVSEYFSNQFVGGGYSEFPMLTQFHLASRMKPYMLDPKLSYCADPDCLVCCSSWKEYSSMLYDALVSFYNCPVHRGDLGNHYVEVDGSLLSRTMFDSDNEEFASNHTVRGSSDPVQFPEECKCAYRITSITILGGFSTTDPLDAALLGRVTATNTLTYVTPHSSLDPSTGKPEGYMEDGIFANLTNDIIRTNYAATDGMHVTIRFFHPQPQLFFWITDAGIVNDANSIIIESVEEHASNVTDSNVPPRIGNQFPFVPSHVRCPSSIAVPNTSAFSETPEFSETPAFYGVPIAVSELRGSIGFLYSDSFRGDISPTDRYAIRISGASDTTGEEEYSSTPSNASSRRFTLVHSLATTLGRFSYTVFVSRYRQYVLETPGSMYEANLLNQTPRVFGPENGRITSHSFSLSDFRNGSWNAFEDMLLDVTLGMRELRSIAAFGRVIANQTYEQDMPLQWLGRAFSAHPVLKMAISEYTRERLMNNYRWIMSTGRDEHHVGNYVLEWPDPNTPYIRRIGVSTTCGIAGRVTNNSGPRGLFGAGGVFRPGGGDPVSSRYFSTEYHAGARDTESVSVTSHRVNCVCSICLQLSVTCACNSCIDAYGMYSDDVRFMNPSFPGVLILVAYGRICWEVGAFSQYHSTDEGPEDWVRDNNIHHDLLINAQLGVRRIASSVPLAHTWNEDDRRMRGLPSVVTSEWPGVSSDMRGHTIRTSNGSFLVTGVRRTPNRYEPDYSSSEECSNRSDCQCSDCQTQDSEDEEYEDEYEDEYDGSDDEEDRKSLARNLSYYSFKPHPIFHRRTMSRGDIPSQTIVFGTENELDVTRAVNFERIGNLILPDHLTRSRGDSKDNWTVSDFSYFKSDGSLNSRSGFEWVTHPGTVAFWRTLGIEILEHIANEIGCIEEGGNRYGQHIHISRRHLDGNIIEKLWSYFSADNEEKNLCFTGRKATSYCQLPRDKKRVNYSTRGIVNLGNSNTVEIRAFLGTKDMKTVVGRIEFLGYLITWLRDFTDDYEYLEYDANDFKTWLADYAPKSYAAALIQ
jgi:hypothetical protein